MVLTYDEYRKKKKKEIEERNKKEYEKNSVSVGKNKISSSDIAPVKQQTTTDIKQLTAKRDSLTEQLKSYDREKTEDFWWDEDKNLLQNIGNAFYNLFANPNYEEDRYKKDEKYDSLVNELKSTQTAIEDYSVQNKKYSNNIHGTTEKIADTILGNARTGAKGIESTAKKILGQTPTNEDIALSYEEKLAQKARQETSGIGGVGLDVLGSVTRMAFQLPFAGNPAGAMAMGFANYGGGAYNEARREGASELQATLYGGTVGSLEMLLNKLLPSFNVGGENVYGKTFVDKVIGDITTNSPLKNFVLRTLTDASGEFTEEYLQEFLEPILKNAILKQENGADFWNTMQDDLGAGLKQLSSQFFNKENLYAGALGALTSGAMGVQGNIDAYKSDKAKQLQNASNTEVVEDIAPVKEQDDLPNSKVRDENGKLLTVYHGTRADFDTYDTSKAGQNYEGNWSNNGKGIYFTDNKEEAMEYAKSSIDEGDPKVKEAQLDITNPFDSSKDYTNELSEMAKEYGIEPYYLERGDRLFNWFNTNNQDIVKALSKYGYDGIVDHGHYTVFDNKQIKSVEKAQPKDQKSTYFKYEANETDSIYKKALYESASKVMNDSKVSHKFADVVAKISEDKKTVYKFTNNQELKKQGLDFKGLTINGLVNENGEVLINVDSDKALNTILGHETTHLLEGTKEYDDLKKVAVEYAKSTGEYQSRLEKIEKLYKGKKVDVEAELTSDIVGEYLFTDEKFVKELSVQKPTVFQKIKELIDDLVVRFKGTEEAKQLRKLQKTFEKAYQQDTSDTDTKFSLSVEDYGMSHRPSVGYGDGSNFEENMPDVFEHPEWYYYGGNDPTSKKAYRESFEALKKVRNNPEGEITIYRATIGDTINEGDWVTPSKTYAEWHNYSNLDSKGNILELKVKAKDIQFAGDDLNEFGYFPNGITKYSLSNFEEQELPSKIGDYNVSGNDVKSQEDNQGRKLSKGQQEYFKDSKARDENGSLVTVYHTMTNSGSQFNEFNPVGTPHYRFGDRVVNYYTNSKDMSGSYASQKYTMADTKKTTSMKEVNDLIDQQNSRNKFNALELIEENGKYYLNVTLLENNNKFEKVRSFENKQDLFKRIKETVGEYDTENSYGKYQYEGYVNITNPYEVDAEGRGWSKVAKELNKKKYNEISNLTDEQKQQLKKLADESVAKFEQYMADPYKFDRYREYNYEYNDLDYKTREVILYASMTNSKYSDFAESEQWKGTVKSPDTKIVIGREYPIEMTLEEFVEKWKPMNKEFQEVGRSFSYFEKEYKKIYGNEKGLFTNLELFDIAKYNSDDIVIRDMFTEDSSTNDIVHQVIEMNKNGSDYDGVIIRNVYDYGGKTDRDMTPNDLYITFNSEQFKAWDNTNPTSDKDIRYSLDEDIAPVDEDILTENEVQKLINKEWTDKWEEQSKVNKPLAKEQAKATGHNTMVSYTPILSNYKLYSKGSLSWVTPEGKLDSKVIEETEIDTFLSKNKIDRLVGGIDAFENGLTNQLPETEEIAPVEDNRAEWTKSKEGIIKHFKDLQTAMNKGKTPDHKNYWSDETTQELIDNALEMGGFNKTEIAPVEDKIQGLESYSKTEIKNITNDYIKQTLEENGLYDVSIKGIEINGSRNRGNARTNSDLDIVVEYDGNIREDDLFNVLNDVENQLEIDGVKVDINPITSGKSGTLQEFMQRSNDYDTQVLAETQVDENLQSITDNDIAPVQEDTTPEHESNSTTIESPFDSKDMKEVGSQKVKAYQFENPEVKPFFKTEAEAMLGELENTVKGARMPIYDEVGNMDYVGVTRETTEAIAYLKDNYNYTYAEIEKGLKAIIEDDGKENIAVAKRIEFMLDDRLRNGYTSIDGTEIPANQDYINLLHEKGYTAYNQEVSQGLTDEFAPVETVEETVENASETQQVEEIAPVVEQVPTLKEAMETEDPVMKAVKNKVRKELEKTIGERRNELIRDDQYANNNIVIKKKPTLKESATRSWDTFQSHFVNRNRQIDKLSKATGNNEIKFKGDRVNNIAGEIGGDIFTAQTDNYGNVIGKSLDAPFESARNEGLDTYFDNYLKHQSNIERHAQGKGSAKVSAEASKKYVKAYESKYPQFKEWAKDVYTYNQNLLDNAVQNGLIDEYFKNTLTTMYGKYVPFYEQNAEPTEYMTPEEIKASKPIKRAKGGSDTNLLGIEQAMIQQTYAYKNAIAKNDLYKEIGSVMGKKVELGADVRTSPTQLDSTLYADENGKYLSYYDKGHQKTVEITNELYQELSRDLEHQIRNLEEKYSIITKPLQKISQIRGQILTTYSPGFIITNPFKDIQDALLNTKNFKGYFKNVLNQSTINDSDKAKNVNEYAEEFKKLTGKDITSVRDAKALKGKARAIYKDYQAGTMWNRFITSYGTNSTSMEFADGEVDINAKNKGFLNAIERANNYMEVMFRYPEFKATLERGGSFTEALYNAREVTTNFGRGGTISKAINRNGATFFNTSVQGMDKFFRNFSGENGARGFVGAVAKATMVGMLPAILNHLLLDDDDEYEALPDYIKDNYYLFKTGYGEFIRIPKGRMISVLGSAGRRTLELADGEKDAFEGYLTNASDQIGASNPLKENVFSPLIQAYGSENGEAWYGGDLVPTRLQNKPKAEQFDEGTDEFSKWLGEQLNISPYKLNYVIDQYSGGIGDIVLPMITNEAKSDGTLLAPLKDKFTANSTDDNKYVGELYDLSEELTIKANGSNASEEDILKNKYLNSIKSQMSELYKEKREIQNSDLSKEAKYERVKVVQNMINALAKEGLDFHTEIETTDNYATVGYYGEYYKTTEGEWYSINEEELEDLNLMGMTTEEKNSYFGAKNNIYKIKDDYEDLINASTEDEQDNLYTEQKRAIIDEVRNTNLTDEEKSYLYDRYYGSTDKLNVITETNIPFDTYLELEYQDFKADKNKKGQSISGSKKNKIKNFIENSGLDYNQKIILHKVYYPADDKYNYDIADYVFNNVETYETRINILEALGFKVDENGVVHWE